MDKVSKLLGCATGQKDGIIAYFDHKKVRYFYKIDFIELMELKKQMDEIENILRLN